MEKIRRNAPCPCGSGKKYKKCCDPNAPRTVTATEEPAKKGQVGTQAQPLPVQPQGRSLPALTCFRSERYVITVISSSGRYKILQVMFGKKDGSLYLNFPYYLNRQGLVSLVHFPGNTKLPATLSLEPGGKATSHLVKYSHHPSGVAHFSQDGKVLSVIRRRSVPLSEAEGHIFTTMFQGLNCFQSADAIKDTGYNKKRTTLDFSFRDTEPEAVKLVGRWYHLRSLKMRAHGSVGGPRVRFQTPDGDQCQAFLLGHPFDVKNKHCVLMLACEAIPRLSKDRESALTFIGGFDRPEIVNDASVDTTFLAFSYPVLNHAELKQRLGSIDFSRKMQN